MEEVSRRIGGRKEQRDIPRSCRRSANLSRAKVVSMPSKRTSRFAALLQRAMHPYADRTIPSRVHGAVSKPIEPHLRPAFHGDVGVRHSRAPVDSCASIDNPAQFIELERRPRHPVRDATECTVSDAASNTSRATQRQPAVVVVIASHGLRARPMRCGLNERTIATMSPAAFYDPIA